MAAAWFARPAALALALAAALALQAAGPPARAASFEQADQVVVHKAQRRLDLLKGGSVIRSFRVALGLSPEGDKVREGDFRTPEGHYQLVERNPDSDFFLSIRISYPSEHDLREARSRGHAPGGLIMIHGMPNEPSHSAEYYRRMDWTNGCIAVSNSDMVDIWLMTTRNTPIDILP